MKILANSSRSIFNKWIARMIWTDSAILLSLLCDLYDHYRSTGWLTQGKKNKDKMFFYCTQSKIEHETTLTKKRKQKAIKILSDLWFIIVEKHGLPSKNYFRVNEEKILDVVNKNKKEEDEKKDDVDLDASYDTQWAPNGPTSGPQMVPLEGPKGATNNIYNNIYNNNIIIPKGIITAKADFWTQEISKNENLENLEISQNENFSENWNKISENENFSENLASNSFYEISENVKYINTYWNRDVNMIIDKIKEKLDYLWIAYDKSRERMFAKHLLTSKDFWEFCKRVWKTRIEACLSIIDASVMINYRKWPCSWPMKIYKEYAEVYNTFMAKQKKMRENVAFVSCDELL